MPCFLTGSLLQYNIFAQLLKLSKLIFFDVYFSFVWTIEVQVSAVGE